MKSSRGAFDGVVAVAGGVFPVALDGEVDAGLDVDGSVVLVGTSATVDVVVARLFGSRFVCGAGTVTTVGAAVVVVVVSVAFGVSEGGGGGISLERSLEGVVAAEIVVAALGSTPAFFWLELGAP